MIELPHDECVTRGEVSESVCEPIAGRFASARDVGEVLFASGSIQSIYLEVELLILSGTPHATDEWFLVSINRSR